VGASSLLMIGALRDGPAHGVRSGGGARASTPPPRWQQAALRTIAGYASSVVAAGRGDSRHGRAVSIGDLTRRRGLARRMHPEVPARGRNVRRQVRMIELDGVVEHSDRRSGERA
jgi:hypothetical protein